MTKFYSLMEPLEAQLLKNVREIYPKVLAYIN